MNTIVSELIHRKDEFLCKEYARPSYLLDGNAFIENIHHFRSAFESKIPRVKVFYAMKINHYDWYLRTSIEQGISLECASIREVKKAFEAGASHVIYYSPGKSDDDLNFVCQNADKITIHLDSYGELERLENLASEYGVHIRAGIRIHFDQFGQKGMYGGSWKKYGIGLDELESFIKNYLSTSKFVQLKGIHFHSSRNKHATDYEEKIALLGTTLSNIDQNIDLSFLEYIDIGGGFDTSGIEGQYQSDGTYIIHYSDSLETYADVISRALEQFIYPVLGLNIEIYTEPGRVLATDTMHILTRVVDIKYNDIIFTSGGGVNMVGWGRYQVEYYPTINLTQPSLEEQKISIYGNLCTPYDKWTDYCYAKDISIGDDILIPFQGTLTYTVAQTFIFDIPPVHLML